MTNRVGTADRSLTSQRGEKKKNEEKKENDIDTKFTVESMRMRMGEKENDVVIVLIKSNRIALLCFDQLNESIDSWIRSKTNVK